MGETRISVAGDGFVLNGRPTYPGAAAQGLLLNVRAINACAEDAACPLSAEDNTARFVARVPAYVAAGVRAFTIGLQGGLAGYEGMDNSAFGPDGALRPAAMGRVRRVVEACDEAGAAVILSLFYGRQSGRLRDGAAVERGVLEAADWVRAGGWRHVLLEIANEYGHPTFRHEVLRRPDGIAALIRLAQARAPGVAVSASGQGDGRVDPEVARAADYITLHFNNLPVARYAAAVAALAPLGKPVLCNEDDKGGAVRVLALRAAVAADCGWGLMDLPGNQTRPFVWEGPLDDAAVYAEMRRLATVRAPAGPPAPAAPPRRRLSRTPAFPAPEAHGGWPVLGDRAEIAARGLDPDGLAALGAWNLSIQSGPGVRPSPIACLAIVNGAIAHEQYSTPSGRELPTHVASIGKSVSSCAVGLWIEDGRRARGPRLELESRLYDPTLLPAGLPLSDPRKEAITLWHVLTHTSGIQPEPDVRSGPGFEFAAYTVGHSAVYPGPATLAFDPGRGYGYSSVAFNHLSLLSPAVVGRPLHEEAIARIFTPIGAASAHWPLDAQARGAPADTGSGGPTLTARDLARYAYLHLRDGRWGDRQVLPAWYVRAARAVWPQCPEQPLDYGLGFWTNHEGALCRDLPRDTFAFGGSGLNVVVVIPSRDLIVLRASRVWSMDMRVFLAEFTARIAGLCR